jgi:hypothetical protein
MIFKLARQTFGCLFSFLFLGFLLFAGALGATLWFLPVYIEDEVEDRTGFTANFDNLRVRLFKTGVEMPDASIENPSDFKDQTFVDLAFLKVDFQLASLFGDPVVIDEFILDIRQIGYVIAPDGRNNAEVFFRNLQSGGRSRVDEKSGNDREDEPRMVLIKKFSLKIDTVKVSDFDRIVPRVREYLTDVNIELQNVTEASAVLDPLAEEMRGMGLSFVFNGFLEAMLAVDTYRDLAKSLLPGSMNTLESGAKTVLDGAEETGKVIKNVFETLNED